MEWVIWIWWESYTVGRPSLYDGRYTSPARLPMTTYDNYPRDLIGYGRTPVHPQWPGQARVALQFVLNYEEGGENCVLHGDPASEAFLSENVGAQPGSGGSHIT